MRVALAPVERARGARAARRDSRGARTPRSSRCPSAPAHWSVFCFAETRRAEIAAGRRRPAEPHAGEERLRRRPGLDDDVGGERPEARQALLAEVEVAVGDVLEHEEAVAARQLDERFAALGGQAHPGRVLVVGDRVQQLRAHPRRERRSSSSTSSPSSSSGTTAIWALEPAERHQRAEVCRRLDDDQVARIEEGLADELERLDRAARDHQLVVRGPPALRRLDPSGERVERPGEPARRRVLECARLAGLGELGEELRGALARERPRIGEPAGERDQARHRKQREDLCDPIADTAARPCREELVPSARHGRHGH